MEKETAKVTKDMFEKSVAEAVAKETSELKAQLATVEKTLEKAVVNKAMTSEEKVKNFNAIVTARLSALKDLADGKAMPQGGVEERTAQILEERLGKTNPEFVEVMKKDLMVTGNGGNLVEQTLASGFLDLLWNETVMGRLGISYTPTATGNLTMPKIVEGVSATYVAENGAPRPSTAKFGYISLSVKKLMALVPISNDLIRFSRLNVQSLVVDLIRKEMVHAADYAFIYGKGEGYEPRGIVHTEGIKVIEDATAGVELTDLMKVELGKNNISDRTATWIMGWETYLKLRQERLADIGWVNRAEMDSGRLNGLPYFVANLIKTEGTGEDAREALILLATEHVTAIQADGIQIDTSREASFTSIDGTVLNAFERDFTAVRGIVHHDFGLDYKSAAVVAMVDVSK